MIESLYYIGIIQAVFAALLIFKKPNKSWADRLLVVWVLLVGVEMLYSLLNLTLVKGLPDIIIIPFAYGPFLYFYTLLQVNRYQKFPKTLLLHLLPVVIFAIIGICWQSPLDVTTIDFFKKGNLTILGTINFSCFIVSILYYWLKVLKLVKRYNLGYENLYSHESVQLRLSWVRTIALWILLSFLVSVLFYTMFSLKNIFPFNPIEIYHVGVVVFLFSITYFGVHQPATYQLQLKKQPKGKVDNAKENELIKQLHMLMQSKKPYLNGELTIKDVADDMDVNTVVLSNALNHHLNKNFFTFINEYRVKEAKERIKADPNKSLTLLSIAYDSGFNSKSSFNALFKKYAGTTPSQYQKNA